MFEKEKEIPAATFPFREINASSNDRRICSKKFDILLLTWANCYTEGKEDKETKVPNPEIHIFVLNLRTICQIEIFAWLTE